MSQYSRTRLPLENREDLEDQPGYHTTVNLKHLKATIIFKAVWFQKNTHRLTVLGNFTF